MAEATAPVRAAERRLVGELAAGAGVSLVGGLAAQVAGRRRDRAHLADFGRQTRTWALVDLAVAAVGAARSGARGPDPDAGTRRARRLHRVLLVNAVLDVGYVAGGGVALRGGRTGGGAAVVVQALFLLWIDVRHARRFARLR